MRSLLTFLLIIGWSAGIAQDAPRTRTVVKLSARTQSGDVVAEAIVDTQDAPDLAAWGKQAGGLCLEWLPKITALLPSDGFVPPKTVTLYFDPVMKGVAHADKARITISAAYVRAHTNDLGMIIHELTHIVQAYPKPQDGFTKPGWLVEGIADYIRLYHFEPNAPRPRINPDKASYRDSYKTTAAFLAWLEQRHAGLVRRLNRSLRDGRFKEDQFQEHAGKPLDELWREFADTLRKKAEPTPKQ